MTAFRENSGRFAPCGTASDDEHLFLLNCGSQCSDPFPGSLRIDRAVYHRIFLDPAHAAFLAADAGADAVELFRPDLCDDVRVRQQRTSETDDIADPVFDTFQRGVRIVDTSGHQDRNIDVVSDDLREFAVRRLFHVHRRMIPPPGVVGSGIDIEGIVAVFLEKLRSLDPFFDIASLFFKFFTRKRPFTPVLDHALQTVTQGNGEVGAAGLRDLFADLSCETQAVFEASAVFVGPPVEKRNRKLVYQVAFMNGMDLNSVEACAFRVIRALSEAFDDAVDLIDG